MNPETPLMQRIRLTLGGRAGTRIWRNLVGTLQDHRGGWWNVGLGPGTSDLVGYASVEVTPAMVGSRVAVFVAIEVKAPGARTAPERLNQQANFIERVQAAGGRAGFANSVEQAARIVDGR